MTVTTVAPTRARDLLHLDSAAGLLVGAGMFALAGWLQALYGLPYRLLLAMGAANVTYGAFSGMLARRARDRLAPVA